MTLTKSNSVIILAGLIIGTSSMYWGKDFNPSLEKVSSHKQSSRQSESKRCSAVKREVFVDGRRLYWGNLGELTKPERFFASRTVIQTASNAYAPTRGNEAQQYFLQELRTALKAFEKRYCFKINWRKKDLTLPDVTAQFIDFWDKEFGNIKDKGQSK